MGLFSFFKKSGEKVLAKDSGQIALEAARLNQQRVQNLEDVLCALDIPIEDQSIRLYDDEVRISGKAASQADREKIVLVLGNIEGIATVDDRMTVEVPEPEAKFYEVKSGDSLSKIAKEVYGDAMKYPVIFEANQPMLKSVDLIYPGQVLRIPNL